MLDRLRIPASIRPYLPYVAIALVVLYAFIQARDLSQFLQFTMIGVAEASIFAIAASGLVLTYTTTGVFNFAHGAIGMISAYLFYALTQDVGIPSPAAIVLVIGVVAPLFGLGLERVMRVFKGASQGTTLTVTIALTVMLIGVAQRLFPDTGSARVLPRLFGERTVTIFGATLSWDELSWIVVAIGIAVGLRFLLFVSRTGVAMRAVVDNPDLAALNGTKPVVIARYSWVLGSVLGAVAGVLFAPQAGQLNAINLTFFVLAAYGAAVVGKLKSLPLTFAGAIALGLLKNWTIFLFPIKVLDGRFVFGKTEFFGLIPWSSIGTALPGIFLFVALLFQPEMRLTVGRVVGRDEPRVPSLVESLRRGAAFVAVLGVLVQVIPAGYLPDATRALVYGVLLLSLVVLTGYSGQISLAQYMFLGFGGWAMGQFFGGDSILGMIAAAVLVVPIGAIVALPALRLQGLYLALVTFAFAIAGRELLFQNPRVYGNDQQIVGRLDLLGLDFSGNKVFFLLCGVAFAAVAVGVLAIRRAPLGRRLSALRDSEAACATLGLDVRTTKLTVFCISSAIAGLAGALFGGLNASVGTIDFDPVNNIVLFLFAFVGGITTASGALIGGLLFAALPLVQSEAPEWSGAVFALVAVVAILLGKQPNGLAGLIFERVSEARSRTRPTAAATPASAPAVEAPIKEVASV